MTLLQIILATLVGGVFSVLLASLVALTFLARFANRMVAFAVGVLLGFALTDILPEAVNLGLDITQAGWILIAGIMGFFLLEKLALWRHDHATHLGKTQHKPQVTMIVIGDGMHNFVDGVLLAATFLTDWKLGWAAAIAIIAHEIPQEVGDFLILLHSGYSKKQALIFNLVSSLATMVGGLIAYFALQYVEGWIPFILALAASSLIYVAVADLIPGLHKRTELKATIAQVMLISIGVGTIFIAHVFLE